MRLICAGSTPSSSRRVRRRSCVLTAADGADVKGIAGERLFQECGFPVRIVEHENESCPRVVRNGWEVIWRL